jgi:hypothetical protein
MRIGDLEELEAQPAAVLGVLRLGLEHLDRELEALEERVLLEVPGEQVDKHQGVVEVVLE